MGITIFSFFLKDEQSKQQSGLKLVLSFLYVLLTDINTTSGQLQQRAENYLICFDSPPRHQTLQTGSMTGHQTVSSTQES